MGKVENGKMFQSFKIYIFLESIYGHYSQSRNFHNESQGTEIIQQTARPWAYVSVIKCFSKRPISDALRQTKCAPQIDMVLIKNATAELTWPILVSIFLVSADLAVFKGTGYICFIFHLIYNKLQTAQLLLLGGLSSMIASATHE